MRLYVSYRNDESRDITEHLLDQLAHRYGEANVQSTMSQTTDQQRDRAIAQAGVVLVAISPWWIQSITTELGSVTAREIATALRLNKMVVPVLIQGAAVPSSAQLPSTISAFSYRQGIILRPDPAMAEDLDRLFGEVNTQLRWAPMNMGLIIGGVVAMILQTGFLLSILAQDAWAVVYFALPIIIWEPIFVIYGVRIAVVRRKWVWGVALILGTAALPAAFVPSPPVLKWISETVFLYAFSVVLVLFGLFGPRKELQRLNRRPAELAARRRVIENG